MRRTRARPLYGEKFMLTPEGNRYGLPAFYAHHAWIRKFNPSGTFAMWNPRVTCQGCSDVRGATHPARSGT